MAHSSGFRLPLGNGVLTEIAGDGDGYHVEANFNYYNPEFNAYHIGEDWNADTGGNTDLGLPVYAISNGTVVERGVADGFGNFLIIRHDLPVPITVNGITTSTVYSFYGHFENPAIVAVGQEVTIGQQVGTMGSTGMADGNAHVHLEIRLAYGVGYENMDGYSFEPSPAGWVDPTDFIAAHRNIGDTAGNTMAAARVVALGSARKVFIDYVGPTDPSDYFKFTTSGATQFALSLTALADDADVYLFNSQGVEVAHSYNFGSAAEAINIGSLAAGTYYVQVRPYNDASTSYNLSLSAINLDKTAPLLSSMTPADNATAVAVNSHLVLTFNEAVTAGSGNIVISNANGTVARTIAVTDTSQVSFSGNTVTINPSSDLAGSSGYYVNIASGVIKDLAGNGYAGISGSTALNFSTAAADRAGNTLAAARAVTLGATPSTFSDFVGPTDTNDYYKFTTTGAIKFALSMTGLTGDADVYLLNSKGFEVAHSYNFGTTAEAINVSNLIAGTYYVRVKPYNGNSTNYSLSLSSTTIDTKAPSLSSMTPADNATSVVVDSNLVLTFSETVTAGSGYIALYDSNGTIAHNIAVTDTSQVSFSGNQVTINPTGDLVGSSSYYVSVAADAIKDLAGNSYAGISGSTAFNFTTVNPPDFAGNTMASARSVTLGGTHTVFTDYVGPTDANDYFKFTVTGPTKFDLALTGLSADADVYLVDSKGVAVVHSDNFGIAAEGIDVANLAAGTYFVHVQSYQKASTHYVLDLFGIPA